MPDSTIPDPGALATQSDIVALVRAVEGLRQDVHGLELVELEPKVDRVVELLEQATEQRKREVIERKAVEAFKGKHGIKTGSNVAIPHTQPSVPAASAAESAWAKWGQRIIYAIILALLARFGITVPGQAPAPAPQNAPQTAPEQAPQEPTP